MQKSYSRRRLTMGLLAAATVLLCGCASSSPGRDVGPTAPLGNSLSAWHETAVKQSILEFVEAAVRPGDANFIPTEERVATFDFDGTVGCEKPDYMEVMVAMARLCELAEQDPELLKQALYRASCDGDFKTVNAQVEEALLEAFAGEAQSFYVDYVANFLETQNHPRFDRPYAQLYYLPMRQLIEYLEAHDFRVYLVSGSQQGLTRTFGSRVLGLPPERLMGSPVELQFDVSEDGARLIRQEKFRDPSLDGSGKVEVIQQRLGRRPVLAFGNSMGDFEMLQSATDGDRPGLALILVHDDPEEYVYEDQKLVQHAKEEGWEIVGMKESFRVLFPDQH